MHKIYIKEEEYTFSDSKEFKFKMFEIKSKFNIEDIYIYIDPDFVKDDQEYFYLLSLRDPDVGILKEKGNRYEVDYFFNTIVLLEEIEKFK